ncbi:Hypothetical predicted protein [Olea europaea subsp. europaea]|uniref:Uncharacterized protein n=1 Tax=Olea europaea subsp. europaea TaxID=158383 RepID=A0A8S0QEG2_OLEEU|nr:Hypothetical predicted protein [Olea europaea subsp. europaea]
MAMSYMTEVRYEKPIPPDRSRGEKRKGGNIDRLVHRAGTSTNPSDSGMKQSTHMLLITDKHLGHSDVHIDDDDFSENRLLSKQLQAMESQVSSLKSGQQKKLKLLVHMQGEICTDMLDIKSHMQCMFDSVTALIPNSMEEIMNKFRENSGPQTVGGSGPTSEAAKVEKSIDSKGKTKHLPKAAPSSGLSLKKAQKPVKALQSSYVVDEVKQMKLSRNVVVFEHYNQNVDDVDVVDFQNWKKFNDKDDAIHPHFSICQYFVGNKTWWYELVSKEVSLTSSISYYTKVTVLKGMS